ncbi:MAG: STAS domain-containing protein [Spongiibacteraceae bacterium]
MAVSSTVEGNQLIIKVDGRFDFSSHQVFRKAYETSAKPDSYVVDMKGTSYIDSSALGMLLLLRDYAGGETAKITIVNCSTDVKKILVISNFEALFEII